MASKDDYIASICHTKDGVQFTWMGKHRYKTLTKGEAKELAKSLIHAPKKTDTVSSGFLTIDGGREFLKTKRKLDKFPFSLRVDKTKLQE